jgi:hypothetical protein
LTEIDPYVRIFILRNIKTLSLTAAHRRKYELMPSLIESVENLFEEHGFSLSLTSIPDISEQFFSELVASDVIVEEDHKFAGLYYLFKPDNYPKFREKALAGDPINQSAQRIGSRYFGDVFEGYLRQRGLDDLEAADRGLFAIPASDRVVSLGDNANAILGELEDLKNGLRESNDDSQKLLGRRDRIIGEISAGQELLRSGSFRVKALIAVLMSTLGFIATEFAGGIIGDLAVKLLEQLKPIIGL